MYFKLGATDIHTNHILRLIHPKGPIQSTTANQQGFANSEADDKG
jgi:hypothetical protein